MTTNDILFKPLALGSLELPHRILMAPLTRSRAEQPNDVPWQLNVEYYRQRAGAALIISEATQISPQGKGYAATPGIYSKEQVEGWKRVTAAVHQNGGRIAMQLWHVGRISHPALQPGGSLPVAPSTIKPKKAKTYISDDSGMVEIPEPRALRTEEIPAIVEDYRRAAMNAKEAGFDAVELHAANGYLIDQFLRDGCNHRDDQYGGSLANRLRFPIEVTQALVDVWGQDLVGVRISPTGTFNDAHDSDPHQTFVGFTKELEKLKIAFIEVVEKFSGREDQSLQARITEDIRKHYSGRLILNGDYSPTQARQAIEAGRGDAVSFGRLFIANPDLPDRILRGVELLQPDPVTYYGGGEKGYINYPSYKS